MGRLVILYLAALIGLGGPPPAATRCVPPRGGPGPLALRPERQGHERRGRLDRRQAPAAAEVRFGADGVSWQMIAAANQSINSQYDYSATLTSLIPGTRYYYRTRVADADLTPWSSVAFTTATTGDDFTLVAFGDSRGNDVVKPASARSSAGRRMAKPAFRSGDPYPANCPQRFLRPV